jgi:GT2 family glycosyltransferase
LSKQPEISIITVNFNHEDVTCDMLESLKQVSWANLEVFVVDNGSSRSCDIIKERFPEVVLIKSPVNLGFAGGNNMAIRQAKGDYILLLNNDTIVPPDFIGPLLDSFSRHPAAGIVSPKIIFYYSEDLIQYAGANAFNKFTCRNETIGYMQKNDARFNVEYETGFCHGACMLISRAVIGRIGLLDENYFMCYEELDYCERAKKAGFSIFYNGHSHIWHKQSVSIGPNSPLKYYYLTRNRIYFARKNFTGLSKLSSVLYICMVSVPINAIKEWIKGRGYNSIAIIKGAVWNIFHKVKR